MLQGRAARWSAAHIGRFPHEMMFRLRKTSPEKQVALCENFCLADKMAFKAVRLLRTDKNVKNVLNLCLVYFTFLSMQENLSVLLGQFDQIVGLQHRKGPAKRLDSRNLNSLLDITVIKNHLLWQIYCFGIEFLFCFEVFAFSRWKGGENESRSKSITDAALVKKTSFYTLKNMFSQLEGKKSFLFFTGRVCFQALQEVRKQHTGASLWSSEASALY